MYLDLGSLKSWYQLLMASGRTDCVIPRPSPRVWCFNAWQWRRAGLKLDVAVTPARYDVFRLTTEATVKARKSPSRRCSVAQ
jgi:hypothetical protein